MPGMNLSSLVGMGGGAPPAGGMPQPGQAEPKPAGGNISQLMNTMPASGIKKTAGVVVAIAAKLLEAVLMAYGSGSPEGQAIVSAITKLSKITKNTQTGDMESVLKSIIQILPAGAKSLQPGSASEILSAITNQVGGPQGGGMPSGAPPQPMPGPTMGQ